MPDVAAKPVDREAALAIFADVVMAGRVVAWTERTFDANGEGTKVVDVTEKLLAGEPLSVAQKSPHTLQSARAMLAAVGRHEHDEQAKEVKGAYLTQNGWPVTSSKGRQVCLHEVVENEKGAAAFAEPSRFDQGRP